jgi:hypothetical protein
MTKAGYMRSITRLVRDYERRQDKLKKAYSKAYDEAMTASEVLAVNDWHDKEAERIRIWFCKRYEKLRDTEVTA